MLFIATLEVLNNSIGANEEIRGIKIKGQEFKLLAFADDLAVILENPIECYNSLATEFEEYSKVSRLKINKGKIKILTKNMTKKQEQELEHISGIQATTKIKYLGVNFTKTILKTMQKH